MDHQSFSVGIKKQMLSNYANFQYGHEAKICKSIRGNGANALYLWAIMQDMPTSFFIRYKKNNNFKLVVSHKYGHLQESGGNG